MVFQILLFLAHLDFVQGRLRNIDVASLDQFGHLTIEKGKQQGANVCTVHISVGHDDDAVVAQFVNIEVVCPRLTRLGAYFANTGAKRSDERQDFIAGQQLFITRFFNIQNFPTQGQDSLKLSVAPLLG